MRDKEIIGYKVLYECIDDGEELQEDFGTEEEAVNRAKYLLLLSKEFYVNIRVHQISYVLW